MIVKNYHSEHVEITESLSSLEFALNHTKECVFYKISFINAQLSNVIDVNLQRSDLLKIRDVINDALNDL